MKLEKGGYTFLAMNTVDDKVCIIITQSINDVYKLVDVANIEIKLVDAITKTITTEATDLYGKSEKILNDTNIIIDFLSHLETLKKETKQ